jgi:hypothetical protein
MLGVQEQERLDTGGTENVKASISLILVGLHSLLQG